MGDIESNTLQKDRGRSDTNFFGEIMEFIEEGTVIPIISNSFRIDEIFRHDTNLITHTSEEIADFYDENRTIVEQLTKEWAESIEYPMPDIHNLARVAQYRQVILEDSERAKKEYLKFLNDRFLKMAETEKMSKIEEDPDEEGSEPGIRKKMLFSDRVRGFDCPKFPPGKDPLRLLAKLDLPIYVTTSYHTFLEQALDAEGKKPSTQVCFLSDNTVGVREEHLPSAKPPTPKNPAVYHLFGLENYARTIVLSEDDYMKFLIDAVENINEQDLFPSHLRLGLSSSRLLLLGYHLRDWDFRTLFRFLSTCRKNPGVPPSILLQLMPNQPGTQYEEKSLRFLEQYFKEYKFKVKWTRTERFIYELWNSWNDYNK